MARPRLPALLTAGLLAALLVVLLTACDSPVDDQRLLLLPTDGGDLPAVAEEDLARLPDHVDLGDVRATALTDRVPDEADDACQADWAGPSTDSPVLELEGRGYTLVRSGPLESGRSMTLVCDYDPDGQLVVADDLHTTGTDQSTGNDYITRAGTVLGRVDVGIPPDAVRAVQTFDDWSLLMPLDREMAVLRLHALAGGTVEEGYDVGTVRFFTADGTDVTAESVPIPDVVHGVPRARGSSVDDE